MYSDIHSGQDANFLKPFSCRIFGMIQLSYLHWWELRDDDTSQTCLLLLWFIISNKKDTAVTLFWNLKDNSVVRATGCTRCILAFGLMFTRSSSWRVDTDGIKPAVPHTCSQLSSEQHSEVKHLPGQFFHDSNAEIYWLPLYEEATQSKWAVSVAVSLFGHGLLCEAWLTHSLLQSKGINSVFFCLIKFIYNSLWKFHNFQKKNRCSSMCFYSISGLNQRWCSN